MPHPWRAVIIGVEEHVQDAVAAPVGQYLGRPFGAGQRRRAKAAVDAGAIKAAQVRGAISGR